MVKIFQAPLDFYVRHILKKYQPKVVSVVGSIGKTSVREAVYLALSGTYTVRRNLDNKGDYWSALSVIIGFRNTGHGFLNFIIAYVTALKLLIFHDDDYPQILVLEFNIERRGQMEKILRNIHPYIGIVTSIGPVYMEYFRSIAEIVDEKGQLISNLGKDDWAIFNVDDKDVVKLKKNATSNLLTYGFKRKADITAQDIKLVYVENDQDVTNLRGLSFQIIYKDEVAEVFLPNSLGVGQVYASLAAIAISIIYGLKIKDIAARLSALPVLPGHMHLLSGGDQTIIIDNSLQISPATANVALDVLNDISVKPPKRKVVIISDMDHLGPYSLKMHQTVGQKIGELNFDLLVVIGEKSRDIARAAKQVGMSEDKIIHYPYADSAMHDIRKMRQTGDVILVLGSQKLNMHLIVKELLT